MTSSPAPISLEQARHALQDPVATARLIDMLGKTPRPGLENIAPIIFDVVQMPNQSNAARVLGAIIAHRPEWIDLADEARQTPLMLATWSNHLDLIDILLKAAAGIDPVDVAGHNALDTATAKRMHHRWQQALGDTLLEGASFTQQQKDRALHSAATAGNLGMTRSLLAHGAGFGFVSDLGTALAAACFSWHDDSHPEMVDIVKALLAAPAARDVIDHGWDNEKFGAPIHCAAYNGNTAIMRLLLDAGAMVNPPPSLRHPNPLSPLACACFCIHPRAIELLLQAGCDAHALDENGGNALHHMAATDEAFSTPEEKIRCVQLLINAGVDPLLKDHDGSTPVDVAVESNNEVLAAAISAHTSSQALESSTTSAEHSQSPGRTGPRL